MKQTIQQSKLFSIIMALMLISLTASVFSWTVFAADFPNKEIVLIAPSGPGSGGDVLARYMANILPKYFNNQTFVVINKPGGSGMVAYEYLMAQPKDGYTVFMYNRSHVLYPYTSGSKADYKKLRGVIKFFNEDQVLVVNSNSPWKNLEEFVAAAKKGPQKMKFTGPFVGSTAHITAFLFAKAAGIDFQWVPSKSGGEALTAVLGGHVPALFGEVAETYGHWETGKLRYLATASEQPSTKLGNVPNMRQKGIDLVFPQWKGLIVAEGVPADRMKILHDGFKKAMDDPEFVKYLERSRLDKGYKNGEDFYKEIVENHTQAKEVATELGLYKP